ncbi:MAG TPA: hypothetical protein VFZ61_13365, partial [Polyangiales bacterium]
HVCGLRADGSLRCAGLNSGVVHGPNAYTAGDLIQGVAAGYSSVALRRDGTPISWNAVGKLQRYGDGSQTAVQLAVGYGVCALRADGSASCQSDNMPAAPHAALATSPTHTCSLRPAGTVACSHRGASFADGPVSDAQGDVIALAAGPSQTCALRKDGGFSCWTGARMDGPNGQGGRDFVQLSLSAGADYGLGPSFGCALHQSGSARCWPTSDFISGPNHDPHLDHVQVASAGELTCAVTRAGGVRCWGADAAQREAQLQASDVQGVTRIALGRLGRQLCVLHDGGSISCWGPDAAGALSGANASQLTDFVELAIGAEHLCALRSNGRVQCWGSDLGQMVSMANMDAASPITQVAVGDAFTCVLRADASMSCWGASPVVVGGALHATGIRALAANPQQPCVVTSGSSALQCYFTGAAPGRAVFGMPESVDDSAQLVVGGALGCLIEAGRLRCWALSEPSSVNSWAAELPVRQVAIEGARVCALLQDGRVRCSGEHPEISGPNHDLSHDLVDLATGGAHTCALRRDGSLQCWGDDRKGQVSGPNADRRRDYVQVVAGAFHTCGLRTDGAARCWGGQAEKLGRDIDDQFRSLRAAHDLVCGLRKDGSYRCWGSWSFDTAALVVPAQPAL